MHSRQLGRVLLTPRCRTPAAAQSTTPPPCVHPHATSPSPRLRCAPLQPNCLCPTFWDVVPYVAPGAGAAEDGCILLHPAPAAGHAAMASAPGESAAACSHGSWWWRPCRALLAAPPWPSRPRRWWWPPPPLPPDHPHLGLPGGIAGSAVALWVPRQPAADMGHQDVCRQAGRRAGRQAGGWAGSLRTRAHRQR